MDCRQCPWCHRFAIKDDACMYVVCGRDHRGFNLGMGCGRAWCFKCGLKLCGRMYCDTTGAMLDANEDHNHTPGTEAHAACNGEGYCLGGHNSHKRDAAGMT